LKITIDADLLKMIEENRGAWNELMSQVSSNIYQQVNTKLDKLKFQ